MNDSGQLPAQIEAVTHRHIHPLTGLRAVRVAGVTRNENRGQGSVGIFVCIVEFVGQPLANLVDRPPDRVFHFKFMWPEDLLRGGNQILEADIAVANTFTFAKGFHLDIDAGHIAAFARNDQQGTTASCLYQGLLANIRKVCDSQNIHHAPRLVGGITFQLQPHGTANRAARTITADKIARLHSFTCFAHLSGIRAFDLVDQHGCYRMGVTRGDRQAVQPAVIIRLQAMRRTLHHIQIHVMHTRLVQNHMRHL